MAESGSTRARRTPFDWVRAEAKGRLLGALTVLVAASSALLFVLDRGLVTDAAPNGIVSFELAGSAARAGAILAAWSAEARQVAMLVQGFDYLYLLVYPAWFSLAADRLGGLLGGAWLRFGGGVSWLVLLAAPLDAVENWALVAQLLHGADDTRALVSLACAVPKFGLVALGAGFLLVGGAAFVLGRRRTGRSARARAG